MSNNDPGANGYVTEQISVGLIERMVNMAIAKTELFITAGEQESYCRLPAIFGGREYRFTVPGFSKRILFFNIEEHPENIRARNVSLTLVNANESFPNGAVRIELTFEENGGEIGGTFKGNLTDMHLSATLGPAMQGHLLTYDRVEVKLDLNLEVVGLPDSLGETVNGYVDKMKSQIADELTAILERDDIRSTASKEATDKIRTILPEGATLRSVRISENTLSIQYSK
jgi:hypothetical protein